MAISPISGLDRSPILVYPISYFAALDRPDQPITAELKVKSLAEKFSAAPQFPSMHPNLYIDLGRRYRFVSELMAHMDAYWDHFREASLHRELLFRLEKRRAGLQMEERIEFKRQDILEAYILHLLFERVFLNAIARRQFFLDIREQSQLDVKNRFQIMTQKRMQNTGEASQWMARQLSPAQQFVVRRPNQLAMQDLLNMATLQSQNLVWDSVALSRQQSRSLSQFFGKEWPAAIASLQDALRRGHGADSLSRIKWIAELFEKAWNQNWQHQPVFRHIIEQQLTLRVDKMPKLWSQAPQPERLKQQIQNEPQALREAWGDQYFWQQTLAEAEGLKAPLTSPTEVAPRPYQWVDRLPQDTKLQPLLWERIQREWQASRREGVHEAAVRNAQFETALADPYGFVAKRSNSRSSLMEQGLQEIKRAELIAPEHAMQSQPDYQQLHQIHIEICKTLAGLDYAASQQAYRLGLPGHQDADLTRQDSPEPIEKVRKTSQA